MDIVTVDVKDVDVFILSSGDWCVRITDEKGNQHRVVHKEMRRLEALFDRSVFSLMGRTVTFQTYCMNFNPAIARLAGYSRCLSREPDKEVWIEEMELWPEKATSQSMGGICGALLKQEEILSMEASFNIPNFMTVVRKTRNVEL